MTARGPEDLDVARLSVQGRIGVIVDANRSRYWRLRDRGLCVRGASHGPADPGSSLCVPCKVDRRFDQMEYYKRTRIVGRVNSCTRCGEDGHNSRSCTNDPLPNWAGPNTVRLEQARARRKARRADGLCIVNPKHAKPRANSSRCDDCMNRRRKVAV